MTEKFCEYVVNLNRELGFKEGCTDCEEILRSIDYHNPVPLNSVDRVFALYLADCHQDILSKVTEDLFETKEIFKEFYDSLPDDIVSDFEEISPISYNNYEREGIADIVAMGNILYIASKGRDYTLKDDYANGGWFGAS